MTSISGLFASGSGLPPIPAYLQTVKNEQSAAAKFGQSNAQAKADLAYLQQQAPKLTTVDALMKDYRALGIVLSAFGMASAITTPALVRQLITQDPTSSTSVAQKIGNATYLNFAKAMGQYKTNPFTDATNMSAITTAYLDNNYEAAQGQSIPGMTQALAFKRQASQITTVAQLMANTSAVKVAVTQIGIDYTTFGLMDYNRQVSLLTKKVKLADFQDAKKVDGMAERYLVNAAQDPVACGASPVSTGSITSLLGGSSSTSILSLFA